MTAVLLLLLLAFAAWLVRPYLPRLEPVLEAEARERALGMSVRQPVELQKARVDTLQRDSEALRLELAPPAGEPCPSRWPTGRASALLSRIHPR